MGRAPVALVALLVVTMVVGCGRTVRAPVGRAPTETGAGQPASATDVYVVRRGDTLYSISWRLGLDYRRLAALNGIATPYVIYPGQRIATRERAAQPQPTRPDPPAAPRRSTSVASSRREPAARESAAAAPPRTSASARSGSVARQSSARETVPTADRVTWEWPVKGPVLRRYNEQGNRGLDIAGSLGTPIRASAPGRVVYSGSGLIGYGKLIIIKHDERYLTAYAHNDKILVSEGETVARGVSIAEMGSSGTNRVKLHFEIRKDGNPVDPERYLPKL